MSLDKKRRQNQICLKLSFYQLKYRIRPNNSVNFLILLLDNILLEIFDWNEIYLKDLRNYTC